MRVAEPIRLGVEVDAVAGLALDERVDDLDHARGDGALGLLRGGPDVVGPDDARVPGERRVPRGRAGAGLVGVHVQAGAQVAAVQRLEQRGLVDERRRARC